MVKISSSPVPPETEDILYFFRETSRKPLTVSQLMKGLSIPQSRKRAYHRVLEDLVKNGKLVKVKGGRYALPREINLVVGTLQSHPDGYGFVIPDVKAEPDLFISHRDMATAMDGDRVVARVESSRGQRRKGRIIRILERIRTKVVGFFEPQRKSGFVIPINPRLGSQVFIPASQKGGAKRGQVVVADLTAYPSKLKMAEGKIVKILGDPEDPGIHTDIAICDHNLPEDFPDDVLEEAERTPSEVLPDQFSGRKDLRRLPLVTIDGVNARDFDDAVAVARMQGGKFRLWVAIADVSSYVTPGSALDREASIRGNSTYFPNRVIPMLPEQLSNGICSLNPGVDRLSMVCDMAIDPDGKISSYDLYPAVIKSRARLTYRQVHDWLENGENNLPGADKKIFPEIKTMANLARILSEARTRRGSLDFDFPEAEIVMDIEGGVDQILKGERLFSHRIIEEFMLAANQAVATFLNHRHHPTLYRVHESPDPEKVSGLSDLLASFGIFFPEGRWDDPHAFREVLKQVEGTAEERLVSLLVLRSMRQARYGPDSLGHFGLALDLYAHFTSPIRRFPDLVVHRGIKNILGGKTLSAKQEESLFESLKAVGTHCSLTERKSEEAERDVTDALKAAFMRDKIGDVFDGHVSGVTSFGFFVELDQPFVEGLVHLTSIADDYYVFMEESHQLVGKNTGRRFRLGDPVKVQVARVDLWKRQIDFSLAPA